MDFTHDTFAEIKVIAPQTASKVLKALKEPFTRYYYLPILHPLLCFLDICVLKNILA